MVFEKGLLKRSFAVLIAASMLTGLLVASSDDAAALPTDAYIAGTVTDGSGPVPNSYVKVMMFTGGGLEINYTFTDDLGEYIVGVPGGFDYMVFVANESYYMQFLPVSVDVGETAVVDFTLDPIAETRDVVIKGYAKDEGGDPITEGNVLGIIYNPGGGDMPYYANLTIPGNDGYFEMNVIPGPAGGGSILMDYPGSSEMLENSTDAPLVSGLEYWFNLTVTIEPSIDNAVILGNVIDFDTDEPLTNVMVAVEIWSPILSEGYSNYTFTDANGDYELNVTNGTARLMFMKGGYSMKMYENVEVNPSDSLRYDVAMVKTTCVVKGNVTDGKTSDPLSFVNVIMMDGLGNFSSTITNDTGYYELKCVDGEDIFIVAQAEGYGSNWTQLDLLPADEVWLDFELWPISSWIEGTVTDGITHSTIENAWVNVESDQYSDWTETDGSGYYNVSVVPGEYRVRIGAMDYRENESIVDVPDEVAVTHDVELLLWDLPETCRMYGWVNDTESTGIDGAQVKVQLPDRTYYKETWTDGSGYYEMMIPPLILDYGVTANEYYPEFGVLDASGFAGSDLWMEFQLKDDTYNPNVTYSQAPVENITWFNPTVIDVEIEEPNLREIMIMQFMFWKIESTWQYFYMVDMKQTSFDPFNPSNDIPYTLDGDNYTISEEWNATARAGWLGDGVESMYLVAYEQWWGSEHYYALRGNYTNGTYSDVGCTAVFDYDTGETLMFILEGVMDPVLPDDDPSATFDPTVMIVAYDVDDWMMREWYWGVKSGVLMNVGDLVLEADATVPSGDYKTWFMANDFAGHGAAIDFVNFTVDNDPPVADAGADEGYVVNTTATLNGSASYDNVGIVSYVWDFVEDGSPVHLEGAVVDHDFSVPDVYDVTLTVTDGAGHEATDVVTLTIADDMPPVADAGSDMTVDEDTLVAFDGVGSTDDLGIDNYTWSIVELSIEMYGISPSYTFDMPDVYTVELVVTDTIGQASAPDSITVTVLDVTDPTANAGLDVAVPSGSTVTLDGSLSADNVGVVTYTWTLDDDGPQTLDGETATYDFDNVGEFVVTLTVEDAAGNSDTDIMTVTVFDGTDPVADAGPDQTVAVGTEVTFDGANSTDNVGIVDWNWTFVDDGVDQTLTGESPTYEFVNTGVFVVTLTVEDAEGNSDEDTVTIRVTSPPIADAGEDVTVTVGATVTFDGSGSSDDNGIENYTWTFTYGGATATRYGVSPSFTFELVGNFTVTLTVKDASGLTDTDTVMVNVGEDDGETAEDKSFLEEYWWLLAAVGVIVLVAAVAAAMMMSKKGKGGVVEPEPPSAEPEELPPPPDDSEL